MGLTALNGVWLRGEAPGVLSGPLNTSGGTRRDQRLQPARGWTLLLGPGGQEGRSSEAGFQGSSREWTDELDLVDTGLGTQAPRLPQREKQ